MAESTDGGGTTVVDHNKKAVLGFFEAVSERRLVDLHRFMTDDVVDHNRISMARPTSREPRPRACAGS
ncbi:hypothetical protein GCM10010129_74660 [Streptomyces fumigatiscleroticus]|nr:hypothetical protein GCM10010129_74660 [Streptomyces fumigatiscleroticus]